MPPTERSTDAIEVLSAADLDHALSLRAEHPDARILAGGTDLMVEVDMGQLPDKVLDIWSVAELRGIRERPSGLWIGALTTHREIVESLFAESWAPTLIEACRTVGAIQIQNRGTLGGNIANASPAGDTLPVLMALDAQVEVASASRGLRIVPMAFLYKGYRQLNMEPDEIVVGVLLPEPHAGDQTHYRKVGTRLAQAISKVVMGARVRIVDGVVTEARVAFGSVAPTPIRCPTVEEALVGRPVDPQVARLVAEDIVPIDDIRSTGSYRSQVAANVLKSWLETLVPVPEEAL
jgi:CO/xanthine dehydrogenase FAD-binding subunit